DSFPEVGQKISGVVIARIKMKFVANTLCLKLPVELRGPFLKSKFILIAAVEIDRQPGCPYRRAVLLGQDKGAVLVPVSNVNGIAEHRSEHLSERDCCIHDVHGSGRLFNQRGALSAYR